MADSPFRDREKAAAHRSGARRLRLYLRLRALAFRILDPLPNSSKTPVFPSRRGDLGKAKLNKPDQYAREAERLGALMCRMSICPFRIARSRRPILQRWIRSGCL